MYNTRYNTTPGVSPNINYRLGVIVKCHCRFISCNKCTTLVEEVDHGAGYACLWAGGIWESYIFSSILLWTSNFSKKLSLFGKKRGWENLAWKWDFIEFKMRMRDEEHRQRWAEGTWLTNYLNFCIMWLLIESPPCHFQSILILRLMALNGKTSKASNSMTPLPTTFLGFYLIFWLHILRKASRSRSIYSSAPECNY